MWLACADEGAETGTTTTPVPTNDVGLMVELTTPSAVPLARQLHATADVPVTLSVTWEAADHDVTVPFPDRQEVHDHLLLGWRGGRSYTVTVTATDAEGHTGVVRADVETEAVPDYFPHGEIVAGAGGERTTGHTLLPMHTYADKQYQDLVVVFDEEGEIVYWMDTNEFILDVREWEGGLLVLVGSVIGRAVHYAWDGTVLGSWACSAPPASGTGGVGLQTQFAEHFHHDVTPDPSHPTRLVGLGRYPLDVPDYPASYTDPEATERRLVANDVLVTYDTETGAVEDELLVNQLLPAYRIGYDSLETTIEGWGDWAHTNSVVFDGADLVVSFRHQDTIAKVDRAGRALKWILANPNNWPPEYTDRLLTPVGDLRWPYHTHAPRVGPDGPNGETVITVFDNGNWQASPWTTEVPDPSPHSRVVQFAVDEGEMTVRQDWQFAEPAGGRLYSEAVGDADPLPNGNILSVWGLLWDLPDGTTNESAGLGDRSVRVIELDPSDPANVAEVEELYLSVARSANVSGWTGYRAERIPSLEGRIVD